MPRNPGSVGPSDPLSATEIGQGDSVARRIHGELGEVLEEISRECPGATALSRRLGMHRPTCARILLARSEYRVDVSTLLRLPGVEGMRGFLAALRGQGLDEGRLAGLEAAIQRYEDYLHSIGGSQRRLAARLAATQKAGLEVPAGYDPYLYHRQGLYEAAAAITGRRSRLLYSLLVFRPSAQEGEIEHLNVTAYLDHSQDLEAVPFVLFTYPDMYEEEEEERGAEEGTAYATLEGTTLEGWKDGVVVEKFSTSPLPLVSSRRPEGPLVQVLDLEEQEAVDLVIAHHIQDVFQPSPDYDPTIREMWTMLQYPVEHMILDLLFHEELPVQVASTADVQLWTPSYQERHLQWTSRLPHQPPVVPLAHGLEELQSPHFEAMADLARYVLSKAGWDPDELHPHRCEVAYPVWRSGYRIEVRLEDET